MKRSSTHPVMALVALVLAPLACSGTPSSGQIVDAPIYVCPTATPRATDTPVPTAIQPPIQRPPSGWATLTPPPGCLPVGPFCLTYTPSSGGRFTTPAYSLPSATSTPRATTTPYPTPTPLVIRPPQPFYLGDPVYTAGIASPVSARFRLLNVQTVSAVPLGTALRQVVVWTLEVKNVGAVPYDLFPAWGMYLSALATASGERTGMWGASRDAAREAGVTVVYESVALLPGETRWFTLAAYSPPGVPARFTLMLDPTTRTTPGAPGSNPLVWTTARNPDCADDILDPGAGGVLPTLFP